MNRLAKWWFAPLPAERIAGLRILIGGFSLFYLWMRHHSLLGINHLPVANFHPIGLVDKFVSRPLDHDAWTVIVYATEVTAWAFTLGILYRFIAPLFAALMLFTMTYSNSWNMVFHTENLLVLHIAALALAPASDAWSLDRWWWARKGAPPPEPDGKYAWGVRTAAVLTVVTYMLAGIAKMRLTGLDWLDGDQLRNQIAYDNLRKALLGDEVAQLALPLIEHPSIFIGLSILTVIVELGSPIALLGGRIALVWVIAAWGFHLGVIFLMAIVFPYPLFGIAYAPLLPVERPMGWIGRQLVKLAKLVVRLRRLTRVRVE